MSCQRVGLYVPLVVLVIIVCQLVALMEQKDLNLAYVGLFVIYVYSFSYCLFLFIYYYERNREASTENTQDSEIFTIPIEGAPPSYEALFNLNTFPPPYEIAIKENWKEMIVEDLPIVCVE